MQILRTDSLTSFSKLINPFTLSQTGYRIFPLHKNVSSGPEIQPPLLLHRIHQPPHIHAKESTVLIFVTIVYFVFFELHISGITAHVLFHSWLHSCNTIFFIFRRVVAHLLKFFFYCMNRLPFLYPLPFYRCLGCF